MRRLLLVLALMVGGPTAAAAPDAASAWKKAHKALEKAEEKPYWDAFERRLGEVWAEWASEYSYWSGDWEANRHEVHTLERIRTLYQDYVAVQESRLAIDEQLAASGDAKAPETLLDALFDVIETCEDLDDEIAGGRPIAYHSRMYDQVPAVKRYGLATRVDGLVKTLAGIEDAAAWLADAGWAAAEKGDKNKSLARRIALLDVFGVSRDAAGRARLEAALGAPEPGLRIVALENLVPIGIETLDVLKPLLADPAPQVRRALLETLARRGADEPRWIPLALEAHRGQSGLVRARALEALGALTGEALPDETKPWADWYALREVVIQDGRWKRPKPKAPAPAKEKGKGENAPGKDDGKGKPDAATEARAPSVKPTALTRFYGVGAPSRLVMIAFDGSTDMDMPADLATQMKRSKRHWQQTASKWRKDFPDQRTLLLQELDVTLNVMPEDARFALIHLWGTTPKKIPVMGRKKPLRPTKGTRRKIAKAIGKQRPQGQLSVEEATRLAFGICGQDPLENPDPDDVLLDTVFLLAPGWNGGRWAIPEAVIADFRRRNRVHRLQVRTIRVGDHKAESERLMQGLAEASGGSYLWMSELP